MCSVPDAPKPLPPLPPQVAPTPAILAPAEGGTASGALKAARGRTSLRIDKTQNLPGAAGNGLNIPA